MTRFFATLGKTLALACLLAAPLRPAQAVTLFQTFVSHSGNDGNPCSAASPCATFAAALTKTSPGGEIIALDSGNFGPVTISESVTIDGSGVRASIISNQNAITINIPQGQTVILRHLFLTGQISPNVGIKCNSAGTLLVDDCALSGYVGVDIDLLNQGGGSAVIENTTLTGGNTGIQSSAIGVPPMAVSLRNLTVHGCYDALVAQDGAIDITNSLLTHNSGTALRALGTATINSAGCTLSNNGTAVRADSGGTVRLTGNNLWNNTVGIDPNGAGVVATAQDNRKAGNAMPGSPTPSHVVAVQ